MRRLLSLLVRLPLWLPPWLLASLLASLLPVALAQGADPLTEDPEPDSMFPPAVAELAIPSGGHRMSGLLYQADGPGPHPTLILLHGFPGNEKNLDIAQVVRRAGFNVLFFHYRGAWGSEGDYALLTQPDDAAAVLAFLRNNATRYRVDTQRLSLLGHSMGGWVALAAGRKDKALVCVGAMAPANLGLMAEGIRAGEASALEFIEYADTLFMLRNFDGSAMKAELLGTPALKLDARLFGAGLTGKSLFMVTGSDDTVTPSASMFEPVVEAYKRNPGLRLRAHSIPGDHAFSYSRIELTRLILDWLLSDCR
jgi:pimeloyl-ACP methyl ester carboxylesterase